MRALIINGPNLNVLSDREHSIYGSVSFENYFDSLLIDFPKTECFQSNHCGELIDKIQKEARKFDGLIINPGGYSHHSIALADCVAMVKRPKVEVHISNIYNRELERRKSIMSPVVDAVIAGCGLDGYYLALRYLSNQ